MNKGFGERMDLHTFGFADGEDQNDTIRGEENVSLFSLCNFKTLSLQRSLYKGMFVGDNNFVNFTYLP